MCVSVVRRNIPPLQIRNLDKTLLTDSVYCATPPTFDRAVLFLDLYDPGRPGLARGLQGDAGLVQALLPEVVGVALGAPPALGFIKVATLISIQSFISLLLSSYYAFIHSVPSLLQ